MPYYVWHSEECDPLHAMDGLDLRGWTPLFGMLDDDDLPDPDGGEFSLRTQYRTGKVSNIVLPAGEALRVVIGGGGGWGDPLNRSPQKVLDDVEDRLNSLEFVESAYGVVIVAGEIDEQATEALRTQRRADRDAGRWSVPTSCPPRWTTEEIR
jgi:N-methylhydantoinase B